MIEFTVPDVSCGHCVKAVTQAVHALDPAAEVQVDLATRRVRIASGVPRERLAVALAEQGYPATAASSS